MNDKIFKKFEILVENIKINIYFETEKEKFYFDKETVSRISNKKIYTISRHTNEMIMNHVMIFDKNYLNIIENKKTIYLYDLYSLKLFSSNSKIIDVIEKFRNEYIDNYHKTVLGKLYFKNEKLELNKYINNNSPIFINRDELKELFKINSINNKDKTVFYLYDIFNYGYRLDNKIGEIFRNWSNSILSQVLINGYYIDNEKCYNDKKKMIEITNIADQLIMKNKLTDEEKYNIYKSVITFNNNIYDAESFINDLLKLAKKQLIIISKFLDDTIFELLKNVKVNILILTSNKAITTKFMTDLFIKDHKLIIKKRYEINSTYIIVDNTIYSFDTSIINIIKENSKCDIIDLDYKKLIDNLKTEKRLD